jgi:hypothetical protein
MRIGDISRTLEKCFVDKNKTYSFWGIYHGLLGDISRTFGGYITDFWGIYHGLLGDISRTKIKKKHIKIN